MTRPILELVVGTTPTGWVTPLLGPLRQWCEPRAGDPSLPTPAARLAIGKDAPGLEPLLDDGIPLALATLDPGSVDPATRARVTALVAPAGRDGGSDLLTLPERSVDVLTHLPVSPFVRSRWRQRLGLRPDLVVDSREESSGAAGGDAPIATVLALASSVVATDDTALLALALGTPTVLEPSTAELLGLDRHGTDAGFLTATPHDALPQAELLADDLPRAATLGRGGRRIVERDFSAHETARALAGRLGLPVAAPIGLSGLVQTFDELRIPPTAPPAVSALGALSPLVGTESLVDAGAGR